MVRIIFSIILWFKLIMPGHAEICFFNFCTGKREETTFENFFIYLNKCVLFIRSYQKDLYVLKTMIVLSLIGTITIIVQLNRVIKGRHRTQRKGGTARITTNAQQLTKKFESTHNKAEHNRKGNHRNSLLKNRNKGLNLTINRQVKTASNKNKQRPDQQKRH